MMPRFAIAVRVAGGITEKARSFRAWSEARSARRTASIISAPFKPRIVVLQHVFGYDGTPTDHSGPHGEHGDNHKEHARSRRPELAGAARGGLRHAYRLDNPPGGFDQHPRLHRNVDNILDTTIRAKVEYADGPPPQFNEEVSYFPHGAAASFAQIAANYTACTSIDSDGLKGTIGAMSFPAVDGKPTHAYQASAKDSGYTLGFDLIYTQVGADEIVDSAYNDLGTPDVQQAQELASKAVEKAAASTSA